MVVEYEWSGLWSLCLLRRICAVVLKINCGACQEFALDVPNSD